MDSYVDELNADNTDYYVLSHEHLQPGMFPLPNYLWRGKPVFSENEIRLFSSITRAKQHNNSGTTALKLKCLGCFLNDARVGNRTTKILLDDEHECDVSAWRTPCQTTAVFKLGGEKYFLQGCKEIGLKWRNVKECSKTPPIFLECGVEKLSCLWNKCPHGWRFFEDEPLAISAGGVQRSVPTGNEFWISAMFRHESESFQVWYAGMSAEGFDLAKKREGALMLDLSDAKKAARALYSSEIQWEKGMLANVESPSVLIVGPRNEVYFELKRPG